MTLQHVADHLHRTMELVERLPSSELHDAIDESLTLTYQALLAASGDLLETLNDVQDHARNLRTIMDAA